MPKLLAFSVRHNVKITLIFMAESRLGSARSPERPNEAALKTMDTLHFERFENKYVVPEVLTGRIRSFIRPCVVADGHAAKNPDRRYTIYSTYLDTPRLEFFHAATNDCADRFKLRIRWYDAAARGPFFLEIKRKILRVVVKDRVKLSREQLTAALHGQSLTGLSPAVGRRLSDFLGRMDSTGAHPVVQCRYTREAYESVFGEYARLTIDRAMCFKPVQGDGITEDRGGWTPSDAGFEMQGIRAAALVELKFTNSIPRWMSDLAVEFGLERVGYSKYCSAIRRHVQMGIRSQDFERIAIGSA